jgi:hypothetical protein
MPGRPNLIVAGGAIEQRVTCERAVIYTVVPDAMLRRQNAIGARRGLALRFRVPAHRSKSTYYDAPGHASRPRAAVLAGVDAQASRVCLRS